jgi:hypothetical protein
LPLVRTTGERSSTMHTRQSVRYLVCGILLIFAGLLSLPLLVDTASARAPAPPPSLEELLQKSQCNGKYRMLLRQIKVEKDRDRFDDYEELGYREKADYAGYSELPKGWWVYVYPYWYIWRDLAAKPKPKRPWGPEQAIGEPDTHAAGDIQTAWASQTPDDQDEWLLLEYAEPVVPTAVLVHETFNPGAVIRVTVFRLDGSEVEVWKGADPTPPGSGSGVSEIPVRTDFKVNRVKLYLDSKSVPGWNEIDAVGLLDEAKKTHWAVAAEASSTYAQPYSPDDKRVEVLEERLHRLEEEMRKVKSALAELKRR